MAPIEATGWSSNTGVQVRPPLTDFQTPPAAPPAYIRPGLDSTTSSAGRRPLITAGPIERAASPASRSGSIVSGARAGAAVQAGLAALADDARQARQAKAAKADRSRDRCMAFSS